MFKGADFSVVRLWFVVWLGGGGGIYSLSAFSQVCAAAKSFVVGKGGLFEELELVQNIRELTQRTAEDFDCFFEQTDTNPTSPNMHHRVLAEKKKKNEFIKEGLTRSKRFSSTSKRKKKKVTLLTRLRLLVALPVPARIWIEYNLPPTNTSPYTRL